MKRPIIACSVLWASLVQAHADVNLIRNGSFEDGTYASTQSVPSIGYFTNQAPVYWDVSPGFDFVPGWNRVIPASVIAAYEGSYSLMLGNDGGYPLSAIGQSFRDLPGETYLVSFALGTVHPGGYFAARINSSTGFYSSLPPNQLPQRGYNLHSFTFIGTGNDTLSFDGWNNNASYILDGVSVTPIAAVPEPSAWALLLIGFGAIGIKRMLKKRRDHVQLRDAAQLCP